MSYYSDPDEVTELLRKTTDLSIGIGHRFHKLSSDISGGVTDID